MLGRALFFFIILRKNKNTENNFKSYLRARNKILEKICCKLGLVSSKSVIGKYGYEPFLDFFLI